MTVNAKVVGLILTRGDEILKYFNFPRSGNESKRDVEFSPC